MSSSNTVLISKRIDKNYKTQRFSFAHTYAIIINKGHLKIFYAICRLTFTLFPTDPVDDEWRKESIIGEIHTVGRKCVNANKRNGGA